jgi:Bacterial Ig-like domain
MVAEIKIIAKSAGGNTKAATYKPGQKLVGQPNTQYQLVVDGKEDLPQGTKIVKNGKDLVVTFPDGQQFEILNWSEVQGSSLSANGAESLSTSGSYSVADISSDIALGATTEASAEGAVVVPAGTTGVSTGAVIAALAAVVGLGAAASGGGGGGGGDSGSGTKPSAPSGALAAGSDTGAQGDAGTNDATPTISGSGGVAGQTIELRDATNGAVLASTTVAQDGTWSLTPTNPLPDGSNELQLVAKGANGLTSDPQALVIVVDSAAPTTPAAAPDMVAASDTGSSNTDNITNDTTPSFTIAAPATGETPNLYVDDVLVASTYDAETNTLTPTTALSAGVHSITTSLADVAGNESVKSPALSVTIDNTAAAPALLDLAAEGDTGGSSTDNITSNPIATITGTAEANAAVTLYDTGGTTVLGTTTADGAGNWSITTVELSEGLRNITAKQTDTAGNQSVASSVLAVTVDTNIAPPTALDLRDSSDNGSSNTDDLTNDNTPTITGGAVEANATVTLYDTDGTTVLGTTTADGSGNWSITSSALSDGVHNLTATQTDAAGNISAASTVVVMIETVAPTSLTLDVEAFFSDDGVNFSDNVTSTTTPTIRGTAEANATVTLMEGTTVLGTTTVNEFGNWAITTIELTDGVHHLTAQQMDAAGNVSSQSTDIAIDSSPDAAHQSAASIAGDYQLRLSDFGITEAASGEVSGVRINSGGNLFLNGVAIGAAQVVSVAQLIGGELEWHAPNLNTGTTIELINYTTLDTTGADGATDTQALSRDISQTSLLNETSGTRFDANFGGGWQGSYNDAIREGGHLATFENGGADEVAARWTAVGYGGEVWVGLEQSSSGTEPDGGWHWITGDTTAPNWGVGEPNNAGVENFGALGASGFINDAGSANGYGIEFENAKFIRTGEAGQVDIMNGSDFADVMDGKGGADELSGNSGDDRFLVSFQEGAPDFGLINGGAGFDVVQLDNTGFAFAHNGNFIGRVSDIEGLHLTHSDANAQTVVELSQADVTGMSSTTDSLYISTDGAGLYGDTVVLSELIGSGPDPQADAWNITGSANNVTTYEYYNVEGATGIKLLVESGINVFGGGVS